MGYIIFFFFCCTKNNIKYDVDQLFYQLPNSAILSDTASPSLLLLEPSPDHFEYMVRDYKKSHAIQSQLHNNTNTLLNDEVESSEFI